MPHLTVRHLAQGVAALAVAVGSVGVAHVDKAVAVTVDGTPTTVHVFGSTVGDALDSHGIDLGEHDVVVPSVQSPISDGDRISVRYGRKLVVTVDGARKEYWTTATTVDAALRDIGVRADGAVLTASRSQRIGRDGLALGVTTPKDVSLTVAGRKRTVTTVATTVQGVFDELDLQPVGRKDVVKPGVDTPVEEGMSIVLQRVRSKTVTDTVAIPFETRTEKDSSLAEGKRTTVREGQPGSKRVVREVRYVDGERRGTKVVSTKVLDEPVTAVVKVGTKPAVTSTGGSAGGGGGGGGAINLARADMWDRIAECESSGNWSINTGNGYYGGLQFATASWLANGGDDFAPRADLASREEQITIANRYYEKAGLSPWGCAHAA